MLNSVQHIALMRSINCKALQSKKCGWIDSLNLKLPPWPQPAIPFNKIKWLLLMPFNGYSRPRCIPYMSDKDMLPSGISITAGMYIRWSRRQNFFLYKGREYIAKGNSWDGQIHENCKSQWNTRTRIQVLWEFLCSTWAQFQAIVPEWCAFLKYGAYPCFSIMNQIWLHEISHPCSPNTSYEH